MNETQRHAFKKSFTQEYMKGNITPQQIELLIGVADQALDFLINYEQVPGIGMVEELLQTYPERWPDYFEKVRKAEAMRALLTLALQPFLQRETGDGPTVR